MAVSDGSAIFFSLAATRVNGTTDQSFDEAIDEIEITTKDSNGAKEFLAGEYSATGSVTGLLDPSDTYAYSQIRAAMVAKAAVAFTYGAGIDTAGGELVSGNVIITGLSRQDPKNAPSTWTANVRITGLPTYGTSAATLA